MLKPSASRLKSRSIPRTLYGGVLNVTFNLIRPTPSNGPGPTIGNGMIFPCEDPSIKHHLKLTVFAVESEFVSNRSVGNPLGNCDYIAFDEFQSHFLSYARHRYCPPVSAFVTNC